MTRFPKTIMLVDEIFASIQGESSDSGKPCVFIRFFGCDIGCSYCDQPQDLKNCKKLRIDDILKGIRSVGYGINNVCITGGEPLNQWENVYPLILELCSFGYNVSIETSGCKPIEQDFYNRSFKYIMDIKCPSSGVSDRNIFTNLMVLLPKDEVKFVISDRKDYEFMIKVLKKYPTSASILVSPVILEKDGKYEISIGKDLINWILKDQLSKIRVQLQIHKFLNVK